MINKKALQIAELLKKNSPNPITELTHRNEFQLFLAVMLSAQTTDKKVNQVTECLFKKYINWEDIAKVNTEVLQQDIYGVNFHKGKAVRMISAAKKIITDFGGAIPHTLAELITIPGVARKSANVIQQELWGVAEGIVVDTHVTRVAGRLGLTKNTDAVKIEKDLMVLIPKQYWRNFSGSLVLHGRYICKARKPGCTECVIRKFCPSANTF